MRVILIKPNNLLGINDEQETIFDYFCTKPTRKMEIDFRCCDLNRVGRSQKGPATSTFWMS